MRIELLLLLLFATALAKKAVPGCPDIDVLDSETEINQDTLSNLLLCFCKVQPNDDVAISCLYGSNIDHLQRATDAVKATNFTVKQISIQHMEFGAEGVPPLATLTPELQSLEIRECSSLDPLNINDKAFEGIANNLRNLTVHGCNLKEVPSSITTLSDLQTLDLSGNKINSISSELFKNKNKLEYLDLSGNEIGHLPENAFEGLEKLHTLVMGDRNYMNETVLEEINSLPSLKVLDLSRADGIFEPPIIDNLDGLEELKLSGCSIAALGPGSFSALKELKQLDLRVNLIENISAYAFDGLTNLERLTLAGNYIRDLDKDVWEGLDNLHDLDVSWNEIKQLPHNAFESLMNKLSTLNLKHNPMHELPDDLGVGNLKVLSVAECELGHVSDNLLKNYPKLEELDLSKCNLTDFGSKALETQKDTLKKLNIAKNHLKTIPPEILKDLPVLEELDVSGNPIRCDSTMADFVFAVEDRYKESAKNSKDFLLANANETICDRPYTLRNRALLDVDTHDLQPYDESADTTTAPTTTATIAGNDVDDETTTAFKLENIFVGSKTNETLFKEEPRKGVYELSDDSRAVNTSDNDGAGKTIAATIAVLGLVSLIAIIAVVLFIRKRQKAAIDPASPSKTKKPPPHTIEDGMVEIELESQPDTKK